MILERFGPAPADAIDGIADRRPYVAWRFVWVLVLRHDIVDNIPPRPLSGYLHGWIDEEAFPDGRVDVMREFDGII